MAPIKRLRGLTLVGLLFALTLFGLPLWMAFQLLPPYLEYFGVVRALQSLQEEPVDRWTPRRIRELLWRRFEANYVETVSVEDVYIEREGGSWVVGVDYEVEKPFFGNIYLLVKFHKEIELTHKGDKIVWVGQAW